MNISRVSDYLHVYEAYRVNDGSTDRVSEEEKQGNAEGLVLTEKSGKQMDQDRANYSDLLMLQREMQNARQSKESAEDAAKEYSKIMEIFRRISKGDIVPSYDEKKLMEYDNKLYMAAKTSQMIMRNRKKEKHESLWKDEEDSKRKMEEPLDTDGEMREFETVQAKNVVEVPAEEASDMGDASSTPIVNISI